MDVKYIESMIGYKATDKDMKCRGFQFELGVWYECEPGEIIKCGANGFHFCDQPSGPWAYYSEPGTRIFKCEAEQILTLPVEPGSDHKRVSRRIRLVEELVPTGDYNTGNRNTGNRNTGNHNTGNRNTGDYNTGDYNTGNCNTGYSNTGNRNTGDYNTGDGNTGHYNTGNRNTGNHNTGDGNTGNRNIGDYNTGDGNTGHYNTGDGNTGHYNTGYSNTGDRNTGDYNTGDRNTGNCNTGHYNTGDGNATDYSSGFFNAKPQTVVCFDKDTKLTRAEFEKAHPSYSDLAYRLTQPEPINFERFKTIPGITKAKLKALHAAHLAKRQ